MTCLNEFQPTSAIVIDHAQIPRPLNIVERRTPFLGACFVAPDLQEIKS